VDEKDNEQYERRTDPEAEAAACANTQLLETDAGIYPIQSQDPGLPILDDEDGRI
jgi:hypothetical protein